jgi:poly(A) polymerase
LPLALALILHDTGKPKTATLYGKSLRFPGHSQEGALIARKVLRNLKYDSNIIEEVAYLIKYHLLGHEFRKMDEKQRINFVNNHMFNDLLKLYKADVLSCYGDLIDYKKILSFYKKHGKVKSEDIF